MKFKILAILLCLAISCKSKSEKPENIIKENTEVINDITVQEIDKEEQIRNCLDNKNILKLPIKSADDLMVKLIESNIEAKVLKCEISDELKNKLCYREEVSYYRLKKKGTIDPILLTDECGDNNRYILVTFKGEKMIDYIEVYNLYEEMTEQLNKNITDFEINEALDIKVTKKEIINNEIKKEIKQLYKINDQGAFVKVAHK